MCFVNVDRELTVYQDDKNVLYEATVVLDASYWFAATNN